MLGALHSSRFIVWTLLRALLITAPALFAQSITIDSGSLSDEFFSGGAIYEIATPGATGDLTLRYGAFAYNIPAPAGNYTVSLFMRETGTGGTRRFSVAINSVPVLSNLDLLAVAGLNELQRDFPVTSTGSINISFTYTLKSAVVSRMVVTPVAPLAANVARQALEMIQLNQIVEGVSVLNYTLTNLPVQSGKLIAIMTSSNLGGDRVVARPIDPDHPKEVILILPLGPFTSRDEIQLMYWTLEP